VRACVHVCVRVRACARACVCMWGLVWGGGAWVTQYRERVEQHLCLKRCHPQGTPLGLPTSCCHPHLLDHASSSLRHPHAFKPGDRRQGAGLTSHQSLQRSLHTPTRMHTQMTPSPTDHPHHPPPSPEDVLRRSLGRALPPQHGRDGKHMVHGGQLQGRREGGRRWCWQWGQRGSCT